MTTNQIRYWELQESKRHDIADEGIRTGQLNETIRNNKVMEGISAGELGVHQGQLIETIRNHKETERQGRVGLKLKGKEVKIARGQLKVAQGQLKEQRKHNRKTEKQTDKDLGIKSEQLKINKQQADAATSQAKTAAKRASEQKRHDIAEEGLKNTEIFNKSREIAIKYQLAQADVAETLQKIANLKKEGMLTEQKIKKAASDGRISKKQADLLEEWGDIEKMSDIFSKVMNNYKDANGAINSYYYGSN